MMTKEQRREKQIEKEMGDCVHFTGVYNTLCKAGVNVRQLVGGSDFGWATRLPCLAMDEKGCEVTCSSRKFTTREEAEATLKAQDESFVKVSKCLKAAHEHAKDAGLGQGSGGRGELPCPAECGGTLRYSVAAVNGHMHAACSTKGCVSWME
jgi:hypothetical protein